MTRILVAEAALEISSFNPALSHYADFVIRRGEGVLAAHHHARSATAGALAVWAERGGVEVIPTYSARALSSAGTLAQADWERLASEFLDALRAAPPVDAVYFSLHGAMAAQQEDDPEGYLLEQARRILGERIPIVASYDLHGILTARMLRHGDALSVYYTYPHVDSYETGARAAKLLLRILDEGVKPVTARIFIPALVRGKELITATGVIGHAVRAAQEATQRPGVLAAGLFWGNPFTDVRELGTNSFCTTDNDPALAESVARRIADLFWQHHAQMREALTPLDEAVRIASATREGTTILMDAADAPSSGASGDSNAILREMLRQGYAGRALLPIVDAPAVRAARAAGVGQRVRVRLGGTVDPRFVPVEVEGTVHMLTDGHLHPETSGHEWYAGDTAVLKAGALTIIITSRAVSLHDRSLFWAHGEDPKHFDAVVVKCPHCQPHMFQEWAAAYVNVDAPGSTSADVRTLGHTRCPRPMFPLDENVAFSPHVEIYRRGA
jgi:microcystin degradation protein MlrC